ncbi:MAG: hypothetical protein V1820_02600 [archaeon]
MFAVFLALAVSAGFSAYDAPFQARDVWNTSSGRLRILLELDSEVGAPLNSFTNFTFTLNGTLVTAWNATGNGAFFNETNFTMVAGNRYNITLSSAYARERVPLNITANTTAAPGGFHIPVQTSPVLNLLNIHVLDNSGNLAAASIMVSRVTANSSKFLVAGGYGMLGEDYNELGETVPRPFLMFPNGLLELSCFGVNGTCGGSSGFNYTAHVANGYYIRTPQECLDEEDIRCPIDDISTGPENYQIGFRAFDMNSFNLSSTETFTPATRLTPVDLYINETTGIMPMFDMESLPWVEQQCDESGCRKNFNASYFAIYNSTGSLMLNNTFYNPSMSMPMPGLPGGQEYRVEASATSPFGKHFYTIYARDSGFINFNLRVWNNSLERTSFKGQALYANGSLGMPNAIVYLLDAFNAGPMLNIINSTKTDSDGKFALLGPKGVVETNCPDEGGCPHMYKIMVMNPAKNSNGANLYYPTEETNGKKYYKATDRTVIIPPIRVMDGGTVSVNATINGEGMLIAELSHYTANFFGIVRDIISKTMTLGDMASEMGSSGSKELVNIPVDAPNNTVNISVFGSSMEGQNGPPEPYSMCVLSTTVTKGDFANVNCSLQNFTKIALYRKRCGSIFNQADVPSGSCDQATEVKMQGGGENIWWNSRALLSNATNGAIVLYADEDSDYLFSLDGKLPAARGANYTLRIEPRYDWDKPLAFQTKPAGRNISVGNAPGTVNFTYYSFSDWEFRGPWQWRLNSTGNHTIAMSVVDKVYSPMNPLNTSSNGVSMKFVILNPDKTNATPWLPMAESYMEIGPENKSAFVAYFNASTYNVPAGKYYGIFKAELSNKVIGNAIQNYTADIWTYSPEWQFQTIISDFDLWLSLPKHSYGFGEWINGTLYVYDPDGNPLQLNATTKLLDNNGNAIQEVAYGSDSDGAGKFSMVAPSTSDYYELLTNVTTISGLTGLSDEWIKVSRLVLEEKRDKDFYSQTDSPQFTVKITQSNGSAVPNATVVGFVDGGTSTYTSVTDANGKALLTFAPSGTWGPGGHDVRFEMRAELGASVIKEEFHSWFEVRSAFIQIFPERDRISQSENAGFGLFIEGNGGSITNVYVDGTETGFVTNSESVPGGTFYRITLQPEGGSWQEGFHSVKATVNLNGNSIDAYSGFSVASVGIYLDMLNGKFDYVVGETATVNVKVFNLTNGEPLQSINVTGRMRSINGGRPIELSSWSNITNSNGETRLNFTLSKGGFSDIKVSLNISGPEQYIGVRASSGGLWVKIGYNDEQDSYVAGTDTVQLKINATGGAQVKATVWQLGRKIDLPDPTEAGDFYLVNYSLPEDSPSGRYNVEVSATNATSGDKSFNFSGFEVGGTRLRLESDKGFFAKYRPGDVLSLFAKLSDSSDNPVSGTNVTFVLGSEGKAEETLGYSASDGRGKAAFQTILSANLTDGFYYARAYMTDSPGIESFAPVVVSSLSVRISILKDGAEAFSFSSGDEAQFNVTATFPNGTAIANPTSAELVFFDPAKGMSTYSLGTAGYPYSTSLNFSGQGSFTAVAKVKSGRLMGFDAKPLEVSGLEVNSSVAGEIITANETNVTVSVTSSQAGTATLKIYAPTSTNPTPIYLGSGAIAADTETNFTVLGTNITLPGIYIVDIKVANGSNSGFAKNLIEVRPTSGESYSLDVDQDGSTANIHTDGANRTAIVMNADSATNVTSTLSLSLTGTGSEYNNSFTVASGTTYFVRLDASGATNLNRTMFVAD